MPVGGKADSPIGFRAETRQQAQHTTTLAQDPENGAGYVSRGSCAFGSCRDVGEDGKRHEWGPLGHKQIRDGWYRSRKSQ